MTKVATLLLATTVALTFTAEAFAASQSKRTRAKAQVEATYVQRQKADTLNYNGTCKRDTGTHTADLNFRNTCDMEEFWARMERRR